MKLIVGKHSLFHMATALLHNEFARSYLHYINYTGQHTNFCRRYFNDYKVYEVR